MIPLAVFNSQKSNLWKLQAVKKVTKSNKHWTFNNKK
jgi:hypothetical protein